MSSALALVLTAAMAVPGNGPEKVSGEVVQEPQRLELIGEWEGIWEWDRSGLRGRASIRDGYLSRSVKNIKFAWRYRLASIKDQGDGKFSIDGIRLGIYRQHGNNLTLCFREKEGRPTSFRAGDGQQLLILHRVKPRK
jgi:hypothetical protein